MAVLEDWREAWAQDSNAALERSGHEMRIDHRTLEAQRAEALELAAEAHERGDEALALAQTVRAVALDREPLPQLSLGAWQLKERGIEVAAVRVWHEVKERALEVGRVAQELAGHARDWLGRVAERALEALPQHDAWGDFFAEAAGGGLRDDLSRDLEREGQMVAQAERVRQLELVKEREEHAHRRDDELDHGL